MPALPRAMPLPPPIFSAAAVDITIAAATVTIAAAISRCLRFIAGIDADTLVDAIDTLFDAFSLLPPLPRSHLRRRYCWSLRRR